VSKYLDGIQQISDLVESFDVIANGTVTVTNGGTQYPSGTDIPRPQKGYRNFVLIVSNKSGQTIPNVWAQSKTTVLNSPVPNTAIGTYFNLKLVTPVSTLSTGTSGVLDLTSEEPNIFILPSMKFLFNLTTAPTAAGTIDWALIGY
jgi:hypothetical protein